jgi:arylsulfatase A
MKTMNLLSLILLPLALGAVLPFTIFAAAPRPNVVIILADDLGYGDVQCYNPGRGKIKTPQIDKLATQGMRFTDGHTSSGVCSPTRYALLTGRYHWRTRLQSGIVEHLGPPLIAPDRLTIAGLAKAHGYRTACIGKWHLGWDWNIPADQMGLFAPGRAVSPPVTDAHRAAWNVFYARPLAGGPTTRGFDEYFGTDVPNQSPYCFIANDRTVGIPTVFLPLPLLKGQLAGIAGPALEDWKLEGILPALGDRAADFIKRQVNVRQPFLLYLPLTSPHTPVAPNAEWRGRSGLGTYADFVMETDALVGRVLAALESSGAAKNTLVVFTSDNGCAPLAYREMQAAGHPSSGPLREFKASVYEGGHRVPFVVRWPGVVRPGSECRQLVHQADLMATVAEILGVTLPANAAEDSFSLLPLLRGEDRPVREHAVSCAASGIPGLRRGPWKLVMAADAQAGTAVQLYHLDDDLGESRNLAAEKPALVAEMRATLEKLIRDGRSSPGASQRNDVEVVRHPRPEATAAKAKGKTKAK